MAETLSIALLLAQTTSLTVQDHANALIRESQATIVRLESQISDLQALIRRETELIRALQLIVTPVRTLPKTVLGRIFRSAVSGDPPPRIQQVLALGQVCSHWRKVALETPEIWVRLLPLVNPTKVEATKLFLERSAPLPLPISLGAGYESVSLALLLDTLFVVPGRWQALNLTTKLLPTLGQIPSGAFRSLEALELRGTGKEEVSFSQDIFVTATRLRRATLWQVSNASVFPLPWMQLTHLALAHDSPQVCLDIILRCTGLISATLQTSGWASLPEPETEPQPVVIPLLRTLEISIANTSSSAHFTPFFQSLSLPKLTSLKLYGEYHSGVITWSPTPFTAFQLRSPLISRLHIDHCALTPEDLQSALQHTPNLSHLEIYNCSNCIDSGVLASLRYTPFDATPLVPKLEVLWLASLRCDFDESELQEMVETRWWTEEERNAMAPPLVARLADVKYTSSRKFSRKFEKRMQVYRIEGLKFEVAVA